MFIHKNKTKEKLKNGSPVYGVISTSSDPQLAELFGLAGFDYYMLDSEHGLVDPEKVSQVVRACELAKITPMARIGSKDPKIVLKYLDAGMMGIMMPGLEHVSDVQMLVDAVKYAPMGKRGMGISRASGYLASAGEAPEYIAFANANTLVVPQFEDPNLINKLGELISVPGVDACIVGPRDLSLAMGFPDGPNHPEVQRMIDQFFAVCKDNGVPPGITAFNRSGVLNQIKGELP